MRKSNLLFYVFKTSFVLLILSLSFAKAKMSPSAGSRSMAPAIQPKYIQIDDVIKALENQKKSKDEAPSVLDWAVLAKTNLKIDKVATFEAIGPAQVTIFHIVDAIKTKIYLHDWQQIKDVKTIDKLKQWQPEMKTYLGDDRLVWSWVQYQAGNAKESKQALQTLFDEEYKKIMKLEVVIHGMGRGPLSEMTKYENAILKIGNNKEKATVRKKMKQIKVHLSNLPESHVVT